MAELIINTIGVFFLLMADEFYFIEGDFYNACYQAVLMYGLANIVIYAFQVL